MPTIPLRQKIGSWRRRLMGFMMVSIDSDRIYIRSASLTNILFSFHRPNQLIWFQVVHVQLAGGVPWELFVFA